MKDLIYILWIIAELVKLSGLPLAINRWPRNPVVGEKQETYYGLVMAIMQR